MTKRLRIDVRKLVLTSATEEARRRGDRRLGTDHLLLGLLHDEDSQAAHALRVSLAAARAASEALDVAALSAVGVEVESLGEGGASKPGRRLLPLTSGARGVLKRAIDEASPLKSGRIESGHFLLALLALERPDPAAELLHALGVDPAVVRDRLAESSQGEVA
ncbi:MAG: Clp protease N-terminal domain-containing protein [Acidimicrobiales bacterium]|jgi:ATP-dependent Clp protease ATP-binding subunit ClpA